MARNIKFEEFDPLNSTQEGTFDQSDTLPRFPFHIGPSLNVNEKSQLYWNFVLVLMIVLVPVEIINILTVQQKLYICYRTTYIPYYFIYVITFYIIYFLKHRNHHKKNINTPNANVKDLLKINYLTCFFMHDQIDHPGHISPSYLFV